MKIVSSAHHDFIHHGGEVHWHYEGSKRGSMTEGFGIGDGPRAKSYQDAL